MNRSLLVRSLAAAFMGGSVLLTALPVASQVSQPQTQQSERGRAMRGAPMTEADRAQMRERMQARMNQRLERLAARLEIKASQQDAWTEYRQTVQSMFQTRVQRPAPDADAATVMRFRAERAQQRAQHLNTMADATAKLQQVLEPNQRKVLDQVVRYAGGRGKHRGGHDGARHRGGEGHHHRHHAGGEGHGPGAGGDRHGGGRIY